MHERRIVHRLGLSEDPSVHTDASSADRVVKLAVLGPGGVGGLLAGVLERTGTEVVVVARPSTAEVISRDGLRVRSVTFGDFVSRPAVVDVLEEPVDGLIVATKASGLRDALERVPGDPPVVVPLLNGLDHLALLRERFQPDSVLAGTIRVEADRPEPGVIVHTSPFLLVEMACPAPRSANGAPSGAGMQAVAEALSDASVPVRVGWPLSPRSEADVMWSKLVRLNALACTTSAYDLMLGEIRSRPELRTELVGAIAESCAVGLAEGAHDVNAERAIAELDAAHDTLGSSMQRDIAAGREPELDAIPGSVLRAAARHDIPCPTISRLVLMIAERAGVPPPAIIA
jgi:2-dehydropantoate 2-reductase